MCYSCHLQPFLGTGEASNRITGKIKLGAETLATLDGHWDQEIYIKEKRTGVSGLLQGVLRAVGWLLGGIFNNVPCVTGSSLKRFNVGCILIGEFKCSEIYSEIVVFKGI